MISLDDVQAAARRIAGGVLHTPSAISRTLSDMVGTTVVLKFENLQFTGSFKERGALNRLLEPDTANGVVAMSAGNHAQALAYHAARLGIPATIVMPAFTPSVKVSRTRVHGARVVLHGEDLVDAEAEARRLSASEGLVFVHPFDDPMVIAGQGTVALELLDDHPDIDTIVVPIGGGGLVAGVAIATAGRASVVGVESERYPGMAVALGQSDATIGGATIAEGIAVRSPGALALPVARSLLEDILIVAEEDIEAAVGLLIDVEKSVVEGAGAAGLAALLACGDRFSGRTVGVILTGGNIDPRLLASVLLRGLVRSGQLVTLQVEIDDRPGSLAQVATILAAEGANIVDVRHTRLLTEISIRAAQLEVVIEVTSPDQAAAAVRRLQQVGFATSYEPRVEPLA
jgi:threonine dehydratase